MIREIIDVKDPRIRQKSKKVIKIDKKIKSLIADLKETLAAQKDPEGVGLAAPQIGKNLRIFLIDDKGEAKTFINPEEIDTKNDIKPEELKKIKKEKKFLEGCLSLPHFYGPIERKNKITVRYLDENGKEHEDTFLGFPAHVIRHEIDHLNGIVFIDRILEQKVPLYEIHGDQWEEVEI